MTIITNYVPSEAPAGGPNFYEFDDTVTYQINIDNNGDGRPDVTYEFRFETVNTNPNTFLYNTGPIDRLDSPNWNHRQRYTVTRIAGGRRKTLARRVPCPPCNIGPRSTPNYSDLADAGDRQPRRGRPGLLRAAGRLRSSSTSARCSTWGRCGPSSRCT